MELGRKLLRKGLLLAGTVFRENGFDKAGLGTLNKNLNSI